MSYEKPEYALWAACALMVFASLRLLMLNRALRARAANAERRFALLQDIAPSFTGAAAESAPATCACILDRLARLVGAQTLLCFMLVDGRLVLGAKLGAGYAEFLRLGDRYEGDTIVDWARDHAAAALVGPHAVHASEGVVDLFRAPDDRSTVGPLAGSRDRVWALAVPLLRDRGYGLRPAVAGVFYLERPRAQPFSAGDITMALTVAKLASDALQRALFADAVRRASVTDQLTQLLTASAFRQRLREEVEQRRYPPRMRDVALFFIDTDHFKDWNDAYGHAAGDRLLRQLADLFASVAHAGGGFAGRNGGDEFCIALLDRTKDAAVAIAENLRAKVESASFPAAPGEAAAAVKPVTISVGVAHFPVDVSAQDGQPAESLLEAADAQMYEAKRAGRNRVAFARSRAAPPQVLYPGEGPIPRV